MTAFWVSVLVSLVTGALVNELCDVAPWIANKAVRVAADMWAGRDAELAQAYKEEWSRVIDDAPGKLTKLLHALFFYFGAIERAARRRFGALNIASRVAAAFVPTWRSSSSVVGSFATFVGLLNSICALIVARESAPSGLLPSLLFWSICIVMIMSFPLAGVACLSSFAYARSFPRARQHFAMIVGVVAVLSGGTTAVAFLMVSTTSDLWSTVVMVALCILWFLAGYIAVWNRSLIRASLATATENALPVATSVPFVKHLSICLTVLLIAIGTFGLALNPGDLVVAAPVLACAYLLKRQVASLR